MIFALRYLFYLVCLSLHAAYGVVRFFTKPGSRVIVPIGVAAVALLQRPQLHMAAADWYARTVQPDAPLEPLLLDVLLGLGWLLLTVAYYLASQLLALILGAFPPVTRPLPPMRRLKPKETVIVPAVVRVVVPPLPRRARRATPPWRAVPAPEPEAEPEPQTKKTAAE